MTTISLDDAAIGHGLGAALPALTLSVSGATVSVIAVETDERPLLVSMLLGGRLRPDSGRVLYDGSVNPPSLRAHVALVDTPVVAEPGADIPLAITVTEECAFAGLPSRRRAVHSFLRRHGLADYARLPLRALPAVERVGLFSELAVLRVDIEFIVVTSPERHGAEPARWLPALTAIAARGIGVVVVTDAATATALLALGAHDATMRTDRSDAPVEFTATADTPNETQHESFPKAEQP